LGRATCQIFVGSWPQRGGEVPLATRINAMPKLVVSAMLTSVAWQNTTVIAGDVPEELAKIKEQPGRNVIVSGGPALVRSLLRNCLLDKLPLLVHPLVRGHGRRWLEDGLAQPLELIGSRRRALRCDRARGFPARNVAARLRRTLGREITYVDAPDDAVRDAPPGFGLDEWFVNALVGLSGLTADPASMAMPARSATPWRGSLDSLRDLSATCSRKWLLS
jgi:dihydrofolate reductase